MLQDIKNAMFENVKVIFARMDNLVSTNTTNDLYETETSRFLTF